MEVSKPFLSQQPALQSSLTGNAIVHLLKGCHPCFIGSWIVFVGCFALWMIRLSLWPPEWCQGIEQTFYTNSSGTTDTRIFPFASGCVAITRIFSIAILPISVKMVPLLQDMHDHDEKPLDPSCTWAGRLMHGKSSWKEQSAILFEPWLYHIAIFIAFVASQMRTEDVLWFVSVVSIPDCIAFYAMTRGEVYFAAAMDASEKRVRSMESALLSKLGGETLRKQSFSNSAFVRNICRTLMSNRSLCVHSAQDTDTDFWESMCRRHLEMRSELESLWAPAGALMLAIVSIYSIWCMLFAFFALVFFHFGNECAAVSFALLGLLCLYKSGMIFQRAADLTDKCESTKCGSGSLLETALLFNGIKMSWEERMIHAALVNQLALAPGGVRVPIVGVVNYSSAATFMSFCSVLSSAFAVLQARLL